MKKLCILLIVMFLSLSTAHAKLTLSESPHITFSTSLAQLHQSVMGAQHRFYYSGDSGYSKHFKEIGERFGPF